MNSGRWRLIGRTLELGELGERLERAVQAGRGSSVLLSGEPGIGKTRLLQAAALEAEQRNMVSAWGRAWELGDAPPYWPWIEILRTLATLPKGREGRYESLRGMLPELEDGKRANRAAHAEHVDAFEVSDAIVSHLRELALEQPLLLLLDDLHAADRATLTVAEFVARQLPFMPVVLLGTHREVEVRRDPGLEQSLARIARSGEPMVLGRLAASEVAELVRVRLGHDDPEVARVIHETTEGNPLFVEELLRLARSRGSQASLGVPAGIRAVIRDRLATLSPATASLLQAAAVVGREFSVALVAELGGVTPAALEEAADEALVADLLEPSGPGKFRFSHALFAETLVQDLPGAVAARTHQKYASILEREHADDPGAPLEEISRHWLAAGAEHAERALSLLERAARRASDRLAFEDAAASWERALELLESTSPGDTERRARFLVAAGEAHARAGNRERAAEVCKEAATLARAGNDSELYARAALALGAEGRFGGRDQALVELLQTALPLLPDGDSALGALVLARLAAARQPEPDPKGPIDMARRAIDMARRLEDPQLLLQVLHSAMGAMTDYAPAEERRRLNREAAELARHHGDRARGLRARLRLVFDHAELADLAGFKGAVDDYQILADEVGQGRYQWLAPLLRAMRADWQGDFRGADELEREAFELRVRCGDTSDTDAARPHGRRLAQGVLRADPRLLEAGIDDYVGTVGHDLLSDKVLPYYVTTYDQRLERSQQPPPVFGDALRFFTGSIHGLDAAEAVAWQSRSTELASTTYQHLLAYAGRPLLITGMAYVLHGVVDLGLMRLALLLGKWDEAEAHANDARVLAEKLGARPILLRLHVDHAHGLLDGRGASMIGRARELLQQARALAEELAWPTWSAEVDRLAARIESMAGSAAENDRPRLSIEREGDTWSLSGFGESCRVRDARGIQMIAALCAQPGSEMHVLDLSGSGQAVDGGDAGELLDEQARREYQQRLREVDEELEEATEWNDSGRQERLRAESEALRAELSRATGLGGRERRMGSATERARVNVQRRIALGLKKIREHAPRIGEHLNDSIKTGIRCVYEPQNE